MEKLTKKEIVEIHKEIITSIIIEAFDEKYRRYYSPDGEGILNIVAVEELEKPLYYEFKITTKAIQTPQGYPKDELKGALADELASMVNDYLGRCAHTNEKGITCTFGKCYYDVTIVKKLKKPMSLEQRSSKARDLRPQLDRLEENIMWLKQTSSN